MSMMTRAVPPGSTVRRVEVLTGCAPCGPLRCCADFRCSRKKASRSGSSRSLTGSLNHLIRPQQQRRRNREAEPPGVVFMSQHGGRRPTFVGDVVLRCLSHFGDDGVENTFSLPDQGAHHRRRATHHGSDQVLGGSKANHLRLGIDLDLSEPYLYDKASDRCRISKAERRECRLFGTDSPSKSLLKDEITMGVFDRTPARQCEAAAALE